MDEKLTLLGQLLKQQGDSVLSGKAKLSLQLDELIFITKLFDYNSKDDFVTNATVPPKFGIILDFLQKTKAIKIVGSNSCDLFSLRLCRSLRYLELYSVPVEIMTDVSYLKSSVRTLSLNRSCSDLCGFLLAEDLSTMWSQLNRANFCFNNISIIGTPLSKLTPYLRHLDLSHNAIRDLGNSLLGLHHLQTLKISFNRLEDIPLVDSKSFTTLIVKNNNIKVLDGCYHIRNLVHIDLRGNCLEYLEQLSPLAHFDKLEHLFLLENPISFNPRYRTGVLKELSHKINADKFYLDSSKVTLREFEYLRVATTAPLTEQAIENVSQSLLISLNKSLQETPNSLCSSINSFTSTESPKPHSSSSAKRLPRPVVVSVSDDSPGDVKVNDDKLTAADSDIANSMVERFGSGWLSHFEGREGDHLVSDVDIDLEKLTSSLIPQEESSEDEEPPEEPPEVVVVGDEEVDTSEVEVNGEHVIEVDSPPHELLYSPSAAPPDTECVVNGTHDSSLIADITYDEDDGVVDEPTKGTQHHAKWENKDVFLLIQSTVITEQDSIGQNLDKLDIRCLENFVENAKLNSIDLCFTHVSPTRRNRTYYFVTPEEMYTFLKEVESIWMSVRDENTTLKELQCLNCQKIFPRTDSSSCIDCNSEMTIPYTPFEVLPTTGAYLDSTGALPRSAAEEEDAKSDVTTKTVGSNISSATTHTDYTAYTTGVTKFINQTNFVKADHTLELFFNVGLFIRREEVLCCYLFAQYAKYATTKIIDCVLVVTNYMVYICKLRPNKDPSLKSRHRLSQLKYLDIGLNFQHFRLEWEGKCAAYKILIYDKIKCKDFIETFRLALPQTTQINKVSNTTISDIQELVFGIDKRFELYAKGKQYHHIMAQSDDKWGIRDRMFMFRTYDNCFPGSELVDMMVSEGECNSRAEAVETCHQMLLLNILHHVKLEEPFKDDATLYRFSVDEPGYSTEQEFKIEENPNKDVLLYQLCYILEKSHTKSISLIISNVKLFFTSEYHQWPLPRLQPPLPPHLRGQHFQVLHELDIEQITVLLKGDKVLTVSSDTQFYELTFATDSATDDVCNLIASLWEAIFKFPLDVCIQ